MKKSYIFVLITAIVVVSYFIYKNQNTQNKDEIKWQSISKAALNQNQKDFVKREQEIDKINNENKINQMYNAFKSSLQIKIPDIGDKFPTSKIRDNAFEKLKLDGIATVIYFQESLKSGSEPDTTPKKYANEIKDKKIQFIRVIFAGKLPYVKYSQVIDARENPIENPSLRKHYAGKANDWIGISTPATYLLDKDQKIIYSNFIYDNESELNSYIVKYLNGERFSLNRKSIDPLGKIKFTGKDSKTIEIIKKYLNSKSSFSILMFISEDCDCKNKDKDIELAIERWVSEGSNVIIIKAINETKIPYEEKGKVLYVYEKDTSSGLFKDLKIQSPDQIVIFQGGKYAGNMGVIWTTGKTVSIAAKSIQETGSELGKSLSRVNSPPVYQLQRGKDFEPMVKAIDKAMESLK